LSYHTIGDAALQLDLPVPKNCQGPFPAVGVVYGSGAWSKGRKCNLPLAFAVA